MTAVTLEASSHALEQRRLDGLEVSVAVFTNLTQDHLDYHKTLQAYREAKARLLLLVGGGGGVVVNGEDLAWAELPPIDARLLVSRFEEAVEVITTLLRTGYIDHEGRYYQVRDFELDSGSPRQQGPPILIGSLGGPRMQRITATYADIWVASYPMNNNTIEGLQLALERLTAACETVGRDPAEIQRIAEVLVGYPGGQPQVWTEMQPISGAPEEIAAALRARAALGFDYLHVWIEPNNLAGLEQFAPVLELLRK